MWLLFAKKQINHGFISKIDYIPFKVLHCLFISNWNICLQTFDRWISIHLKFRSNSIKKLLNITYISYTVYKWKSNWQCHGKTLHRKLKNEHKKNGDDLRVETGTVIKINHPTLEQKTAEGHSQSSTHEENPTQEACLSLSINTHIIAHRSGHQILFWHT